MSATISAFSAYEEQLQILKVRMTSLKRKQNLLGWARLALFIVAAVIAFYIFNSSVLWGIVTVALAVSVFLVLVSIDTDNNYIITNTKNLIRINEEELLVLAGQFNNRFDGSSFSPAVHDYANDLDIFGPSSLFQYINRCHSEQGKNLLAENFLQPISIAHIHERHQAIKELSPQYEWRNQLSSYLLETPVTCSAQQKLESWGNKADDLFTHNAWAWLVPVYSFIAVSIGLATITGFISLSLFSVFFFLFFIISGSFSKKASSTYALLNGITKEAEAMQEIIACIEKKEFKAPLLLHLQQSVMADNVSASKQIKLLQNILNRFELRLNWLAYIFLNTFLLWDVRQVRALTQWKYKNKDKLTAWFQLIAQFEVLHSLSTLYFNNPQWCWPGFAAHFELESTNIGHPLIPETQRVTSNFNLNGYPKIAIVTGSNMAGKSTFLRSLGVNYLLAQMGSPVCAQNFTLSPARLISSMRIADNLAENTSTFYAELKKLKTIVDAVKSHEPVFILLDEILRGTNSTDRHYGSKALIRQILKENGIAVIATHDIELAHMKDEFMTTIENYHFDVQVKGEDLFFDYKLKYGICTNLNASILMKKIGIEL